MTIPSTPPTEMRGEDVPKTVHDAACGGYSMHGAGLVANLIAAAWPEIERIVREQVASEFEEDADAVEENSAPHPATAAHVSMLRAAARSARGDTR